MTRKEKQERPNRTYQTVKDNNRKKHHCCIERERRPVARNYEVCQVVRDLFLFGPILVLYFLFPVNHFCNTTYYKNHLSEQGYVKVYKINILY